MRIACVLIVLGSYLPACHKDAAQQQHEDDLLGRWAVPGLDTLTFEKQNGKYLLSYRIGFNDAVASPTAFYRYTFDGTTLTLVDERISPAAEFDIDSFKWKQRGKSFDVTSTQLFPVLSAIYTMTFRKI